MRMLEWVVAGTYPVDPSFLELSLGLLAPIVTPTHPSSQRHTVAPLTYRTIPPWPGVRLGELLKWMQAGNRR